MKKLITTMFLGAFVVSGFAREINLVQNSGFEIASTATATNGATKIPDHYELKGAASWGFLGTSMDFATHGIIFSGTSRNGGSVSQFVANIDQHKGRWITFRFRGLAESGFVMNDNSLEMKIEFFPKTAQTISIAHRAASTNRSKPTGKI